MASLSMDLLRASLGLYRGSLVMAKRFKQEALKRSQELEALEGLDSYTKKLITNTQTSLISNSSNQSERLLMYSVLFKNLVQAKYMS